MRRNKIKQMYYKATYEIWKDKEGNPTKEYIKWVEDRLMSSISVEFQCMSCETKIKKGESLVFCGDCST